MHGLTPEEIRIIKYSKAGDLNGFAIGFLGRDRYRELGLNKIDLNRELK